MTRLALRLLALALALALAACTAPIPAASRQQQTVEGVTISLEAADNPRINLPQQFIVTLTDAQGQPITGAQVYLELDMPAMPMAENKPIAEAGDPGVYRAQTAYTMSGEWTIDVVATVGGTDYRATFTRTVAN